MLPHMESYELADKVPFEDKLWLAVMYVLLYRLYSDPPSIMINVSHTYCMIIRRLLIDYQNIYMP